MSTKRIRRSDTINLTTFIAESSGEIISKDSIMNRSITRIGKINSKSYAVSRRIKNIIDDMFAKRKLWNIDNSYLTGTYSCQRNITNRHRQKIGSYMRRSKRTRSLVTQNYVRKSGDRIGSRRIRKQKSSILISKNCSRNNPRNCSISTKRKRLCSRR